jgi:hypothetical protein
MLWILPHEFDETAERLWVLGRISGTAPHGRREMRGNGSYSSSSLLHSTFGQLSSMKNSGLEKRDYCAGRDSGDIHQKVVEAVIVELVYFNQVGQHLLG